MTKKKPQLYQVGEVLYGSCWQTDLSRDLGISDRTVRRWVVNKKPPPTVWGDNLTLVKNKKLELDSLIREIEMLD